MFISPNGGAGWALESLVSALRAAGEPTRLRALALLARGELSVGELSQALGQSQPRVSRHLKLLTAAGLAERTPEAAWVFYRLPPEGEPGREIVDALLARLDQRGGATARDAERLAAILSARETEAAQYFEANAADWDRVRALHQPDSDVESAVLAAAGPGPFDLVVDVGCGTGRMLELFAPRARRLEGFDLSRQMLAIARTAIGRLPPGRAAVRLGDVYAPPPALRGADLVVLHQVLHFLTDPAKAIQEATALARPGGRVLVVDFAPHELEFLRERHAHRRLGFGDEEMARWFAAAGAPIVRQASLAPSGEEREALIVKVWVGERAVAPVPEKSQ